MKICKFLVTLLAAACAALGVGADLATGVPAWCDIPGPGEAKRPGPLRGFDDSEPDDDWIGDEGNFSDEEVDICELALACLPPEPDPRIPPCPIHAMLCMSVLAGRIQMLRIQTLL